MRKVLHFHFGHITCCFTRLHLFGAVCSACGDTDNSRACESEVKQFVQFHFYNILFVSALSYKSIKKGTVLLTGNHAEQKAVVLLCK